METLIAAIIASGAIASTYFFCVRPGMRGRCAASGIGAARTGIPAGRGDEELDRQLAQLREDIRVLHAQDLLDAAQSTPKAAPPRES